MSVDNLLHTDDQPPESGATRRRRGLRGLLYVLTGVLILVLLAAAGVVLLTNQLGDQVGRYPSVFAGIDQSSRPAAKAGQTFLLVGTDSRSTAPTTGSDASAPDFVFGAQRSDVMMVVTIADDGKSASVISIPRDSWVNIPGHGMNKINAAFSFGGPSLAIQTVEQLTKVRIDHFAVIDFAGFQQMTDAAGGIDVNVGTATERDGIVVPAGPQHLNGAQALVYVRERKSLPGGDFDRVRREQNALRALVSSALSSGTLSSPTKAYDLVNSVTQHVGVDDSLTNTGLAELVFGLRDLRGSNIAYLTVPTTGTGMEGSQSVVYLDQQADQDLWFAVNTDKVQQWADARPNSRLGDTPH
ncbi:LCP family protein [Actinomycetospora endophytica]|uniref:LCP family protein n=1 Tax=Actinomycetospora endophytica TaxID=2291215 RepID=A0ABS8P247_9PSEU|nr:LCP family protein [Actinomycetospora endophytica]MCD2192325.1 LCP family protein [Actinomycetospora endophytica]